MFLSIELLPYGPLTVTFNNFVASAEVILKVNSAVQLYSTSDILEQFANLLLSLLFLKVVEKVNIFDALGITTVIYQK